MQSNRFLLSWVSLIVLLLSSVLFAQPWISNRFAQNCAACHAPGRYNQPAADRRCTLSCQGCHVNPNGGGIRNRYGVWNSQRWLKSFRVDFLEHKKAPSPITKQSYNVRPSSPTMSIEEDAPARSVVSKAPQLAVTEFAASASDYDKNHDTYWKTEAKSYEQFLSHIPLIDPYREERQLSVTAGADFRYFVIDRLKAINPDDEKIVSWLMGVDIGIRIRPTQEKLSFVFEDRFLNQPNNGSLLQAFTTENRIRSAYVLVDDLSFNSYAMYGLYRPMFGLYDPDHRSLAQAMSGLTQRGVFHAVGIGAAPNIPFANANLIFKNPAANYDQSSGYVLNIGGRWVTWGLSALLSIWKTKAASVSGGDELTTSMKSISIGFAIDPFIYNGEYLNIDREYAIGSSDAGSVITNQVKLRFWEENYLVFNYAASDVTQSLAAGTSSEMVFGIKSFLLPGFEFETLYIMRKNDPSDADTTEENSIQIQAHLFI